jgi:hypothetical protein
MNGLVYDDEVSFTIGVMHDSTGCTNATSFALGMLFMESYNIDGAMFVIGKEYPTSTQHHSVSTAIGGTMIPTVILA